MKEVNEEEGHKILIMKIEGKEGNKDFTYHKLEDIKDQFPLPLGLNTAKEDSKENKDPHNFKNVLMSLKIEMKIEMRERDHNIEIEDRVDLQGDCPLEVKEDIDNKDQGTKKNINKAEDLSKEGGEILHKVIEKSQVLMKGLKKDKGKGISIGNRRIDMDREDITMKGCQEIEKGKAIIKEGKDHQVQEVSIIQKGRSKVDIEIVILEKDMKEKEYKEEAEVEIIKADTIKDQTKEIDQGKDKFKEEDKEKDNHTEKGIIAQEKIKGKT